MRTLVLGDLHGNYKGLIQCLERCGFDYLNDMLIQLGDVVDGGEQSYECVDELLKIENLVAIKGNHDDWFLEFISTGYHPTAWTYGGISTIKSYGKKVGKVPIIKKSGNGFKTSLNPVDIPMVHRRFFQNQKLYYVDKDNNCFIHAGFNRFQPFEGQAASVYFWDRTLWQEALNWQVNRRYLGDDDRFEMVQEFNNIFLGHTSTMLWGIDKPLKAAHIYNVDTGGSKGGRLTIMDVVTKHFWQSDD